MRQEYKEKTKGALIFAEMPSDKKSKGRGRGRDKDYISNSDSEAEPRTGSPSAEPKSSKAKRRKRSVLNAPTLRNLNQKAFIFSYLCE